MNLGPVAGRNSRDESSRLLKQRYPTHFRVVELSTAQLKQQTSWDNHLQSLFESIMASTEQQLETLQMHRDRLIADLAFVKKWWIVS